jgi:hypothetical protein
MALVRDIIDELYYEIQGILTLEDILEVSYIINNECSFDAYSKYLGILIHCFPTSFCLFFL